MKKCFFCIAIALCIFCGNILNAGGLDMKQIPASAKWLLHIDVEQLLGSKLGEIIRDTAAFPEVKVKLDGLEAATSLNLLRDVHSVTIWGGEKPEKTALVFFKGNFDKAKFAAIIRALDGFEQLNYGSHYYYSWVDEKHKGKLQYGGFVGDNMIFVSPNKDVVIKMFDTVDGKKKCFSESDYLSLLNKDKTGFIVLGSINGLGSLQGVSPHAAILKKVENAYLSICDGGENLDGKIILEAINADTSEQVKGVVLGLKSLAEMSLTDDPVGRELVGNIKIKSVGKQVEVGFACPVSIIKDAFEKQKEKILKSSSVNVKVEAF